MKIELTTSREMAEELHALAVIRRAELAARCKEIQRCADMPLTPAKRREYHLDQLRDETNRLNEWKLLVLKLEALMEAQCTKRS